LLKEMVDSGIEAILIKVAAIGLKGDHLGRTLKEMYPVMEKLNQEYELHMCGEGGEFESFTLNCPLFKRKGSQ